MRTRISQRIHVPLIVAGAAVMVLLQLLNAVYGYGHSNGVSIHYPGGRVITEPGEPASALNVSFAIVHVVGAALIMVATVWLLRGARSRAVTAYIAAAICGLFPSPAFGLMCLVFGALVTGTWRNRNQRHR
ncbi:hypothetical protein ACRB68_36230 [Actinomadura sp. RB68]|uniref:Uncharacterized protein n=2 Tax=Actinomadura macrotermitis TaxID=2585200 RepID=A0A7K0BWU8_9ACTN|nr:hypothetical protein [Actinomadura macrotermitis]